MIERLRATLGGMSSPKAEIMSVTGDEPCEDCGSQPADDLVGVRWLCSTCAPGARRAEREERETSGAATADGG